MLTTDQIRNAKAEANVKGPRYHEHDDCIRMAYEWLDAQIKTKCAVKSQRQWKHQIEKWCQRYVSEADVEVAAWLHPAIKGCYPFYNISTQLTLPSERRLNRIGEARKHSDTYSLSASPHEYLKQEN